MAAMNYKNKDTSLLEGSIVGRFYHMRGLSVFAYIYCNEWASVYIYTVIIIIYYALTGFIFIFLIIVIISRYFNNIDSLTLTRGSNRVSSSKILQNEFHLQYFCHSVAMHVIKIKFVDSK